MKRALMCCALVALAACSTGQSPVVEPTADHATHSPGASTVTGSLDASDITSDGKTVTVKLVEIKGAKGFIAWHTDSNGAPGPVVGHSALLAEGTSRDVQITLDQTIASGVYWPMLHSDSNSNGTYDFPTGGQDAPVSVNGNVVMKKINVTVS